jgi:hypothetical protein
MAVGCPPPVETRPVCTVQNPWPKPVRHPRTVGRFWDASPVGGENGVGKAALFSPTYASGCRMPAPATIRCARHSDWTGLPPVPGLRPPVVFAERGARTSGT